MDEIEIDEEEQEWFDFWAPQVGGPGALLNLVVLGGLVPGTDITPELLKIHRKRAGWRRASIEGSDDDQMVG